MRRIVVLGTLIMLVLVGSGTAAASEPAVRVAPRPGNVALTFDDGPHPVWTPLILDILDEYGVRATFFVNGWRVDDHPDVVAEIAARGHSVQTHTYGHENLLQLGNRTVRWTLTEGARAIRRVVGESPTCMRPPFGATSQRVEAIAVDLRLDVVMWDINTRDYAHNSASAALIHAGRAEAGDIILMHDMHGYLWVTALPMLIEGLAGRGIGFDTLCERPDPRPETLVKPALPLQLR